MSKKNLFIYLFAVICILAIILIPIFCPSLKNDNYLMLMMQGLNVLAFLHISYKLSTEDYNKYINQQKFDNERLNKQLKFDLVNKYVNEYEIYLKDIQNINEVLNIVQFYNQETLKFDILTRKFETENLKLMNIFNSSEYDKYLFIQSNFLNEYYSYKSLAQKLNIEKKYTKENSEILDVDEHYINSLSFLSIITDYLYYILLHNADDYEMRKKLEISKKAFNERKLKNINRDNY